MSLIKILPEYLETFSLSLHPEIRYHSSSFQGPAALTTGSMPLSARPSKCLKNMIDPSQVGDNSYDLESPGAVGWSAEDYRIVDTLEIAKRSARNDTANIQDDMNSYMNYVSSASQINRNTKRFEIERFDPPYTLNLNANVKNCIRNVLMPYYSSHYDGAQFSYTNYNTLNFFTSSLVPSNSAIIYQNMTLTPGGPRPYSPSGSFTFDFWINPRYTNESGKDYKAGTIMHLSSSYAISLVSSSLKNGNNQADGFRIMLQLSHSADVTPSSIAMGPANNRRGYPDDLVFLSDEREATTLRHNHWHHVCIRWGTQTYNQGSGSIEIDGNPTYFNVPSGSILPPKHVQASALFLGNYYEASADINEAKFFDKDTAIKEGVYPWEDYLGLLPTQYSLDHPLNAEMHEIKIYDSKIDSDRAEINRKRGKPTIDSDLMFYVPPYFLKETRNREVILTPFQTETKQSTNPFNANFSFGVGGYLVNLENFTRDMITGYSPKLLHLTASTLDYTVLDITANGYVFASGSTRKRNLTVLPNDNGKFTPNYQILQSGSIKTSMSQFKHDLGGVDLSIISLNNMVPTSSMFKGLVSPTPKSILSAVDNQSVQLEDDTSSDSIEAELSTGTPEAINVTGYSGKPGPLLTIYQRTRDASSNEITVFDISNLFYGNRILPGSFYITDPNLTGSGGKVKMSLRDNGRGGLYRADCKTPHAKWSNVGTILYNEGLAVVKSPHISYFGQDEFEASFKGDQNVHILTVNVPATTGLFNSSSNPNYLPLSASSNPADDNTKFVYITGLNLHDDNLNVIMRGNLAQPVKKRGTDEVLIRFKTDF
jgi:hypothetical protein